MCLLTNERYKTYQTGFSFGCLGHSCPRGGTLGERRGLGVKIYIFLKFNQNWCVSHLHECHMQRHICLGPHPPLWPLGGAKRSNIIKSQLLIRFQIFLNQTLCVFSQIKDIKKIRREFLSIAWVMSLGWDLGVLWGVGGSIFFAETTIVDV